MRFLKALSLILILSIAAVWSAGGIKQFDQDKVRIGDPSRATQLRALIFQQGASGTAAQISVDPANDEFNFNNKMNTAAIQTTSGDVVIDGIVTTASTTKASKPCPSMTQAQRDAIGTPTAGLCIFNTDSNKLNTYNGSLWEEAGSGGGGGQYKNFIDLDAANVADVSDFTCGNNAIFDGGGTLQGTHARVTTPLIDTTDSANFKFTQNASSLNDYCYLTVSTDEGIDVGYKFHQAYDGSDDEIQLYAKCATSGAFLAPSSELIKSDAIAAPSKVLTGSFFVPVGCGDVKFGWQVKVLNNGAIFQYNRINLNNNPFVSATLADVQDTVRLNSGNGYGSTNNKIRRYSQIAFWDGSTYSYGAIAASQTSPNGLLTVADSATLGTSITLNRDAHCTINSHDSRSGGAAVVGISLNTSQPTVSIAGLSFYETLNWADASASDFDISTAWSGNLKAGDIIREHDSGVNNGTTGGNQAFMDVRCTASSQHIIAPKQQISSEDTALTFKSTAIDCNTDPVGTYNTYSYAVSTNNATICGTAPTTAPNLTDGILIFTRAYNAASTCASPARYNICVGRQLRAIKEHGYQSAAKGGDHLDLTPVSVSTTDERGLYANYNSLTGVYELNAGVLLSSSNTSHTLLRLASAAPSTVTSGYIHFYASKVDNTAIPNFINTSIDLTGSGNFTGGDILISRVGNNVSISAKTAPTFASSSAPSSASGLIPSWARPVYTGGAGTVYDIGATRVREVHVANDGTLSFEFRDWAGGTSAITSAEFFTISFSVE